MKARLAFLFIVATISALAVIATTDASSQSGGQAASLLLSAASVESGSSTAPPDSYLPGEGGSYYAWHNTGIWCSAWGTWHRLMYWNGSGWSFAGPWACF